MKERKNEQDPIVKKSELDKFRKNISDYFAKQYPDWLVDQINEEIRAIVKDAIDKKPKWFLDIVKSIIEKEIKDNLKVSLSGYGSLYVNLNYKGNKFSYDSKYI